jgi:hypothetical protein
MKETPALKQSARVETEGIGSTALLGSVSFFQVCRLLWDWRGWRYTGYMDEVTYRDTGIEFFLDQSAVRLRRGRDERVSNPFAWWFAYIPLCWRLRSHLPNKVICDDHAAKPSSPIG